MKLQTLLLVFACSTSAFAQIQRYEPRYDATDEGRIIRHGDGPDNCDLHGMRQPSIVQEDGKFYLFYDGCAAPGWLASLATSDDLKTWKKHGRMLSLGPAGSDDSATASSPWLIKEGDTWHMFYVASPSASPAPDYVPIGPYLTMTATSKSLYGPWTQRRDIVPFRPKPGSWYEGSAYPGHIIKRDDEYLMFFNGGHGIARTRDLMGSWEINDEPSLKAPVENASIYYEESNGTYWMFVNHIRLLPTPHTDATWVYWTKDLNQWDDRNRAVVLDGTNSTWSKTITGMATVTKVGDRLAIFYDGNEANVHGHMGRDIGLAWLDLPLSPDKVRLQALPPSEEGNLQNELGEWIWDADTSGLAVTLLFQGSFDLPAGAKPKSARLVLTVDDAYTVWLNGEQIGSGTDWSQLGEFEVAKYLRTGRNLLSIEATNNGGPGGLIAGITAVLPNGELWKFGTSGDWRYGTSGDADWFTRKATENWQPVTVLGGPSATPWNLTPPSSGNLPEALVAKLHKPAPARPNALIGGGFERDAQAWKFTGGDRIAYDWTRFPRPVWMGDYYFWLNGPKGSAEQTTSAVARTGAQWRLLAEVGLSLDMNDKNVVWPGGRMIIFTDGPDGPRDETEVELPEFSFDEAGTFKPVSVDWEVPEAAKDRMIGVRLVSDGIQIAWDNVRLEAIRD